MKQPGGTSAYDSHSDVMVLRSPFLSTKIGVPDTENLRSAEVLFGVQKDMYKNADLVLNEREATQNINKNAARHIIAQARIEQNLKKVGSMVHFVKPVHLDEILLPKVPNTNTPPYQ